MKFIWLFLFTIVNSFDHSYSKTYTLNKKNKYESIWWDQHEAIQKVLAQYEILKKIEKNEEIQKALEQEKRNKIFRDKLVSQIRGSILKDFWTNRY